MTCSPSTWLEPRVLSTNLPSVFSGIMSPLWADCESQEVSQKVLRYCSHYLFVLAVTTFSGKLPAQTLGYLSVFLPQRNP